jgi:type II secretory ATPase GspE/PulE/Tfp pilus assembly ATPase PilB-like protein
MESDIWAFLGFEKATLDDLEGGGEEEKQPAPLKMAYPELNEAPSGADDWRGQEPVERIVNTILLCAVRDGASAISIEPQTRSVCVRYTVNGSVREHIKLPMLALEPIVARFKRLAQIEMQHDTAQWGSIRIRVDGRHYDLHVQTHPTEWGERVELRFSTIQ